MYLKTIKLVNFRNYKYEVFNFDPKINFIIGNNAQGKTNLLEAIFYLSTGNSYRTNRDAEVAFWNSEGFFIQAEVLNGKNLYNIELLYQINNEQKTTKIGRKKHKSSKLFDILPVVLFVPEHMELVKRGPSQRRKFINTVFSCLYPTYYYYLRQYNRSLEQKNKLLKYGNSNRDKIDINIEAWNRSLINLGSKIIFYRVQQIKHFSRLAKNIHQLLTNNKEDLIIKYRSFISDENPSLEEIMNDFKLKLEQTKYTERNKGYTVVGPQRDDIDITINGREARQFASQGQQRTIVLSLKLAEAALIVNEKGFKPLILLDDVFSELDQDRRRFVIDFLKDRIQIFITATQLGEIKNKYEFNDNVFYIQEGKIKNGSNCLYY